MLCEVVTFAAAGCVSSARGHRPLLYMITLLNTSKNSSDVIQTSRLPVVTPFANKLFRLKLDRTGIISCCSRVQWRKWRESNSGRTSDFSCWLQEIQFIACRSRLHSSYKQKRASKILMTPWKWVNSQLNCVHVVFELHTNCCLDELNSDKLKSHKVSFGKGCFARLQSCESCNYIKNII